MRKIQVPKQPIVKEELERRLEQDDSFDLRTNGRGRGLKSGKDHKASKKSKKSKSEKYAQSYDEDSYSTDSYPIRKIPLPSPTYGARPAQQRGHYYSNPTQKPISYYDPNELNKYGSYSDMIDYYYIQHKGDSNSIDEQFEPSPISPAFSPVRRPFMDSPVWSYSEDEETEPPSMMPSGLPSPEPYISPSPSMGQCLVRVGLDRCSTLLETVVPKQECDCYNFCAGIYLGCCAIDDPCPLSCEVLGGFVAGCMFEDSPTPVTANPSEDALPSRRPSVQSNISEEPTLPGTSTDFPTETPELSPTIQPSPSAQVLPTSSPTQVPVIPSGGTDMPTNDIVSISLEPFTLEYEITFSRSIAQSDLVVLASITNSYLQVYMSGAFQSDSINMADFVTEYSMFLEDPGSSVVLVTFKSTAFFDPSTEELPSRIDLERERASAFQGAALGGYLGRVQALPTSNAFSTTSQIFLVQNPPTVSTLESREFSGVAAATAIFVVVVITSLASFSWYRTRRRRRRLEASDNFLRKATGTASAQEPNIRQRINEDEGSNGNEKGMSNRLLEDIERIEDLRRNFEDYPDDVELTNQENASRRSGFESDNDTYLYEDDTIEDDEYTAAY